MKRIEAVFIDRDGTVGGTGHFIHPREFIPYSYSRDALSILKQEGIKRYALTNQHRISRGEATLEDFYEEFKQFDFDDAFICPHSSKADCRCHKPEPGMLLEAAEKHNLDLTKTCVIGDVGSTDMLAAHAVGALKILVLTGWGRDSLHEYRHTWEYVEPDYIAENLLDAVHWLLQYQSL